MRKIRPVTMLHGPDFVSHWNVIILHIHVITLDLLFISRLRLTHSRMHIGHIASDGIKFS